MLYLVWINGLIYRIIAHFFASQSREEGSTAKCHPKVAGEGAYVGAFTAMDAEVGLGYVRGHFAERVLVEVFGGR